MRAIIEITKGSLEKTEINKETGKLEVDRPLENPIPYNYGFVPDTFAADGDALDIIVLGDPIPGLTELDTVPFGILLCMDNGDRDDKILALPAGSDRVVSQEEVDEVVRYLNSYKKGFKVLVCSQNLRKVLSVYKASKLKEITQHAKLSPLGLVGILTVGLILALFDWLSRK